MGKPFPEKIFGAEAGAILLKKPNLLLSHDNTASIHPPFGKMGGDKVKFPDQI